MLPDYPEVKGELAARLVEFLEARREHYLGPLRQIRRSRLFEGDQQVLIRASGDEDPTDFKEVRAGFKVEDQDLPTMTLDKVLINLDRAAEEMAGQMARGMYEKISETVEQVGNVFDAEGQRFSVEMILQVLSRMQIEFNKDGTPQMPQIHIHPSLSEAVQLAEREFEQNQSLKRQLSRIIEEKREEWRAREANRRLVG